MKWIIIGVVITIVIFLFTRCGSPKYLKYDPKDNNPMIFSFKFQPTDSINQSISLVTVKVIKQGDQPMYLQTQFKGQRKFVEKLLAVHLKLYAKNENTGLYDQEIVIKNTFTRGFNKYVHDSYGFGEENYTDDLYNIISPADDYSNVTMEGKKIIYIDNQLMLGEYPKEVKAIISVKWQGGEQEFTIFLTLREFKPGSAPRTNPFG